MVCVICDSGVTEEGARVLHGKVICPACVAELTQGERTGTRGLTGEERQNSAEDGGGPGAWGEGRGPVTLQELNAELVRLGVAEEDLGPSDCTVAHEHGTLFQLTDGCSSVVASGEKLLERLRMLPDGAGDQATWWMLADL